MQAWAGSLSEHHPRRRSTTSVWRCPTAQPSLLDRAVSSLLSTVQYMAKLRWTCRAGLATAPLGGLRLMHRRSAMLKCYPGVR